MVFAHDTETALAAVADLVNSAGSDGDKLTTGEELDAFVARWRYSGARTHDGDELAAVRALRPQLRLIWTSTNEEDVVGRVNSLLSGAGALPQLVRHDDWDWHLHATAPDQPLATRMSVEAAMAFVDVIRAGERDRLRVCSSGDCNDVVLDLSRNRSRMYCESGCGNRAHVAAYRARRAARSAGSGK